MLGKLWKWLGPDRSEEPPAPEPVIKMAVFAAVQQELKRHRIEISETQTRSVARMLLKREKIAAIKFLREESPRQLDLKGAKGIAEALEKLLKAQ